jgi:hypothetical protein
VIIFKNKGIKKTQKLNKKYLRFALGWMSGFEPPTSGTTNQRSNQLSYNHHLFPFAMQRYEKLNLSSKPICKKCNKMF